jgi:predicted O-linked N-acetylglucosamine transferase (SPINDLY family)
LLVREPEARVNLCREAQARDVDPRRLVFADEMPQADHLARHRLADLLLDTWPYSAHTTASDALWMGLPVVALCGRSFASRVSSSILRAAGLADLVTDSLPGYEALILELGRDRPRLERLRHRVESTVRASPLFDTAAFTRALEDCYAQMWRRHQAGLAPAPIQAVWPSAAPDPG